MKDPGQHSEWLSLIDVSGPFLAEPILNQAFPQGLEQIDPLKRKTARQAYDEWREAIDLDDPQMPALHMAWIDLVLKQTLELDEDGKEDVLKPLAKLPKTLNHLVPEHGITLRPDCAVVDEQKDDRPLLLIQIYSPEIVLDKPIKGDGWATSPAERMVELCRASDVRLGLVTNGEQWMLIDAPVGATTTFASWYARLWGPEPATLQAFVNLLGIRRFFVDPSEQLPALLDDSLKLQDEVTEALGEQVRRAVEVLIQALDRADVDRNRELLEGVEPPVLYEAGLTIMMRIVFLLSAEERGLLLMGDERYEANYAVSTLRMQLRAESEEILERRWDAWSRLLSIFRAVYGGIEHEAMRLPALGGSLFDPDRFPFLEGRAKGSNWKINPAVPLPIDNRTVLLLLDAVQLFQGRTLSYRALDVEQIGYVYEGLLERTVVRAKEVTLDLDATKSAKKPWVTLNELETTASDGNQAVDALLKDRTGSSASRVKNDLAKKVDEATADMLLTACHGNQALRDRIKPYFHFLRIDRWGYPLVYPEKTFMVTTGADRRETGTHYTPKSLTEAIVKETLEPIAYIGPAEGKPREEWTLKTPAELLHLKICDPAMGSGAFLVQACRWLSERLVEAWEQGEAAGNAVTSEGVVVEKCNGYEPLRNDAEERLLTARRLIAERCLYGVDINPLAVELAKLSIWLVTLAKGRPFGFLDHNLRSGDSLLGIHNLDQLHYLDMKPGKGSSKKLFASKIDQAVEEAVKLRSELRSRPIRDIRDVEIMANLDEQARQVLNLPELIADALVGDVLAASGKDVDTTALSIEAGGAMEGDDSKIEALKRRARKGLSADLPPAKAVRRPFHWPVEFPEVFSRENCGFDAFIGNPPFSGGNKITGTLGTSYRNYLVEKIANGRKGSADLVAYFFLNVFELLRVDGTLGLLAVNTISEGDTREIGLEKLIGYGAIIFAAYPNEAWPGKAAVITSRIHAKKGDWVGEKNLRGQSVQWISAYLSNREEWVPLKLKSNINKVYQGAIILGMGFTISPSEASSLLEKDDKNKDILFPYLIAREVNQNPNHTPQRWVINFWDWTEEEANIYTEPYEIIVQNVKPERIKNKRKARRERWWQFAESASGLYHAIGRGHLFRRHPPEWDSTMKPMDRVIVFARGATKHCCFTVVDNKFLFADSTCVIANSEFSLFAVLSSDIHTIWAWKEGGRMKQDLRYTHESVFETFSFPDGVLEGTNSEFTNLGRQFFEERRDYMLSHEKGMTKFYNDFHDPKLKSSEIEEIRNLQTQLNNEVLKAYGFDDIDPQYGFHQVDYLPEDKNTRFTVSEKAREKLLYRLALLNKRRHEEEANQKNLGESSASMRSTQPEENAVDLFAAGGKMR